MLLSAQLLSDANPVSPRSDPAEFVRSGDVVYFAARTDASYRGTATRELWKTDGTAQGTALVKDIIPGAEGSEPRGLTDVNGTLFFVATDATNRIRLFKSDGTAAGTGPVASDRLESSQASPWTPSRLVGSRASVYFVAAEAGGNRPALWKSDGTDAGTVLLRLLDGNPSPLAAAGGSVYFAGSDAAAGVELWKIHSGWDYAEGR